jgi:hypothetical protein
MVHRQRLFRISALWALLLLAGAPAEALAEDIWVERDTSQGIGPVGKQKEIGEPQKAPASRPGPVLMVVHQPAKADGRSLPRLTQKAPRISAALPRISKSLPRLGRDLPRMSTALPRLESKLPRLDESLPRLPCVPRIRQAHAASSLD